MEWIHLGLLRSLGGRGPEAVGLFEWLLIQCWFDCVGTRRLIEGV